VIEVTNVTKRYGEKVAVDETTSACSRSSRLGVRAGPRAQPRDLGPRARVGDRIG
jgi:hypothetical protein